MSNWSFFSQKLSFFMFLSQKHAILVLQHSTFIKLYVKIRNPEDVHFMYNDGLSLSLFIPVTELFNSKWAMLCFSALIIDVYLLTSVNHWLLCRKNFRKLSMQMKPSIACILESPVWEVFSSNVLVNCSNFYCVVF